MVLNLNLKLIKLYSTKFNATSYLSSLLCKSSVSKYIIMVRSVTNEITNIYIYIYIIN